MSEMIERMAKAMLRNIYESGGHKPPSWEEADKWQRGAMLSNARAAIEVMRSATNEMANAGAEARWQSPIRDANNVREIWSAMIDMALAE